MDKEKLYDMIAAHYELDLESLGYSSEDIKRTVDGLTEAELENMKNGIYADLCSTLEMEEEDRTALRNNVKGEDAYIVIKENYKKAMNEKMYFEGIFWAYDMLNNRLEMLLENMNKKELPFDIISKCSIAEKTLKELGEDDELYNKLCSIEPSYENETFDGLFAKIAVWCKDINDFTKDFIIRRSTKNVNGTARDMAKLGEAYAEYLDRCVKSMI